MMSVSETKHVEDNTIPPYNMISYILPHNRINNVSYLIRGLERP